MAKYRCSLCGEIYDEEYEGVRFADLPDDWVCPMCHSPKSAFVLVEEDGGAVRMSVIEEVMRDEVPLQDGAEDIRIDPVLVRHDGGVMDDIHAMAETGRSVDGAMETLEPVPDFRDILFLGAQLSPMPCDTDADVSIRTVIGRNAKRPMELESPVYISHMSFGSLSGRAKIALAKGSAMAGAAMCSGEGGCALGRDDRLVSLHLRIHPQQV